MFRLHNPVVESTHWMSFHQPVSSVAFTCKRITNLSPTKSSSLWSYPNILIQLETVLYQPLVALVPLFHEPDSSPYTEAHLIWRSWAGCYVATGMKLLKDCRSRGIVPSTGLLKHVLASAFEFDVGLVSSHDVTRFYITISIKQSVRSFFFRSDAILQSQNTTYLLLCLVFHHLKSPLPPLLESEL